MDAFLPGVAGWEAIYNNPFIWHFRFNGPTPEALVKGREDIYFAYFWNDLAADRNRSLPQADRQAYVAAYSRPGRMRAGWDYFVSFQQAAKDLAGLFLQTRLTMPLLTIAGDKSMGEALGQQARLVACGRDLRPSQGHRPLGARGAGQRNHRSPRKISLSGGTSFPRVAGT